MTRKHKMLRNELIPKTTWPCGQSPSIVSFPRINIHVLPVSFSSFNWLPQFIQIQITVFVELENKLNNSSK